VATTDGRQVRTRERAFHETITMETRGAAMLGWKKRGMKPDRMYVQGRTDGMKAGGVKIPERTV
jgi:hypothetical protein